MKRFSIILVLAVLTFSCSNDELFDGSIAVKGKVYDVYTNEGIANVQVVVEVIKPGDMFGFREEAGRFTTNSSGEFSANINTLSDASGYEFFILGDTSYFSNSFLLNAEEVENQASNLTFGTHLLTNITIHLEKTTPPEIVDTVSLSWGVSGIYYGPFYECSFTNYENSPTDGFRWIGGKVNSVIKTKTVANKDLELILEIYRNGIHEYVFDTVYCERNVNNVIHLTY